MRELFLVCSKDDRGMNTLSNTGSFDLSNFAVLWQYSPPFHPKDKRPPGTIVIAPIIVNYRVTVPRCTKLGPFFLINIIACVYTYRVLCCTVNHYLRMLTNIHFSSFVCVGVDCEQFFHPGALYNQLTTHKYHKSFILRVSLDKVLLLGYWKHAYLCSVLF